MICCEQGKLFKKTHRMHEWYRGFHRFGQAISRWWFGFRLKPFSNTAPAASMKDAQFKRDQN